MSLNHLTTTLFRDRTRGDQCKRHNTSNRGVRRWFVVWDFLPFWCLGFLPLGPRISTDFRFHSCAFSCRCHWSLRPAVHCSTQRTEARSTHCTRQLFIAIFFHFRFLWVALIVPFYFTFWLVSKNWKSGEVIIKQANSAHFNCNGFLV